MSLSKGILICACLGALAPVGAARAGDGVDQAAAKAALLKAYPGLFIISGNVLVWNDGTRMIWDDGKQRTPDQMNEAPDIEDMFHYRYPRASEGPLVPPADFDPGRIRYKPFFKKLYGATAEAVRSHIVPVRWPGGRVIRVTNLFGIARRLREVSKALEARPELRRFVVNPGGGFNWRNVAGTRHLSMHAFGAAVDINVKYSDYWRWHKRRSGDRISYRDHIPMALVALFEKHGFIWGGRFYHYDTMHFEYRPELLFYLSR